MPIVHDKVRLDEDLARLFLRQHEVAQLARPTGERVCQLLVVLARPFTVRGASSYLQLDQELADDLLSM